MGYGEGGGVGTLLPLSPWILAPQMAAAHRRPPAPSVHVRGSVAAATPGCPGSLGLEPEYPGDNATPEQWV